MPALRHVTGLICTICHTVYAHPTPTSGTHALGSSSRARPIDHCPHDGGVLVDARSFTEAGEDPMLGQTIAGRFVLLQRQGAGSMGTVYRARQEPVGRDVALKILRSDRVFDENAKTRFEREARATSVLVSPNTVTVFDFGEADDGSLFLAMELLEGESLGSRLRREGRLPARAAVHIAREALASLAEAHAKGIIHRDIKPDNLFLTRIPAPDGRGYVERCKVLDFGIAKMLREEARVDALETQAGTVFGTPRYMSPEQAQGKTLDARSDLYSLALIVYQMLVGQPPFSDDDAVVVMAQHIKTPPPPMRDMAPEADIPQELEMVVHRALAKSPDRRPSTADDLSLQLADALSADASSMRAVVDRTAAYDAQGAGWIRRNAAWVVAAVAGAVAIVSFGLWLFGGPEGTTPASSAKLPSPAASLQGPLATTRGTSGATDSSPAVSAASGSSGVVTLESLPAADPTTPRPAGAAGNVGTTGVAGAAGAGARPASPTWTARPPVTAPTSTAGSKYGRFE